MSVSERIKALRLLMQKNSYDAFVITGTDPHLGEYIPDYWKTRKWISGFSGSYGRVVVTSCNAALWTDSRYFLQAQTELEESGIDLMKERQPDSISIVDWLAGKLPAGSKIAVDDSTIPAADFKQIKDDLAAKNLTFIKSTGLLSEIWIDRPEMPSEKAFIHPVAYAGVSAEEKRVQIISALKKVGADLTILSALDDIAWSFNIRGKDVSYNPVVMAYATIEANGKAKIYLDSVKIDEQLKETISSDSTEIMEYHKFAEDIGQICESKIILDPWKTNAEIYQILSEKNQLIEQKSIPELLKSIKNGVQIEGMRNAHIRDGAAMINFLHWFSENHGKIELTELTVEQKLYEFRSQQPLFEGESFHPIVGYAHHGAIVHYSANKESDIAVGMDSLLLIDSGGQYLDGTTDITRTISTGKVTQSFKDDFTLVLKGMIALTKAVFPEGTKGYSLDSFARKPLWDNGLNYGHGTGHGIGHFLNVHEGPMSIRQEYNPEPIRAGQILSNEPGLYRPGAYGIRTENVILCVQKLQTDTSSFLGFETLTLCPIDQSLINKALLTNEEIEWLNSYHATIEEKVAPLLSDQVRQWLSMQWKPF